MKHYLHLFGTGLVCLCALLTSCDQKGPKMKLKMEIINALEDVKDKAGADEAAQVIKEAFREYKKDEVGIDQYRDRYDKLRNQIQEKEYYHSRALRRTL